MPQTFANTINSNPIYADRAEKDAAGNTISTTYATKAELPTVPVTDVEVDGASVVNQGVAEITMPTVDQTYDSASSNAQSGVAMAGALASKQDTISAGNGIDITNNVVSADLDGTSLTNGANGLSVTLPVPDTTGASQGDVLSVGQSGIEWVAPSSGSSDLFYATYASTTFNEIQNAVNDGKYVILSHQGFLVPLTAIIGTSHFVKAYFQTINNPNNSSSSNSLRLTTYICNYSNKWSSYLTFVPPTASASDAGKVLTVNSSGNAEWATPSGGGSVTDVEVNGTSVVNASGVAEVTVPAQVNADWNSSSGASEILNKPTIPSGAQLVPAATSADADKVLTVDSLGVPGWAIVPSQSTGLFQAEYGTTTYAAIVQAINDKKIVYCRLNSGASRMAFLAYIGSSNVEFQYYRSLSSHSASNMTDEVYVYTVSSSGWTTTTRKTGVKVVAGTHMTQSYSSDTLTLNATWPTVDQTYDASSTNAQSGVAVASALASVQAGLFEAIYGTTTYADVLQAISDQKIVYCNAPGAGNTRRMAVMTFQGTTDVEFQYYRSNSSGTDSVFIYTVSSEGWTTTERSVTGYAASTYNASSTLAQSGVAVAQAIATKEDAFNIGTGLAMDTIGSTKTLRADETVLWSGNAAAADFPLTLSESLSHFERVMFVWIPRYQGDFGAPTVCDTQETNGHGGTLKYTLSAPYWNANTPWFGWWILDTSDGQTKLTTVKNAFGNPFGGATFADGLACRMIKVIGVHRIANN